MKKFLLIAVCLMLGGCATATSRNMFGERYNKAISAGTAATIIKEGVFENIRTLTFDTFASVGYKKVLFSDNQQGFIVVVKDVSLAKAMLVGEPHIYKIILKFTETGEQNKTRIDLVNATDIMWAQEEVDRDIQQLADIIRTK
jgi:hypothetical protein